MTYDTTTQRTKHAMAASLKKLAQQRPFSKVTVSDIVKGCGINRNTFYYHFEDIYALLKWTLEQEAIKVVRQIVQTSDFKEATRFIADYIDDNKVFLRSVYHSLGQDMLRYFFQMDVTDIVYSLINQEKARISQPISTDFEEKLCLFYTAAIAGFLIDLIVAEEHDDHEGTIETLTTIVQSTLPAALNAGAH